MHVEIKMKMSLFKLVENLVIPKNSYKEINISGIKYIKWNSNFWKNYEITQRKNGNFFW